MVTAGVPLAIWLIQRGHTSIEHFILYGIALGNLPFVVYLAFVISATVRHVIGGTLAACAIVAAMPIGRCLAVDNPWSV